MNMEMVELKNEIPGREELTEEELLARGWAALPESYRIPEVAPSLEEALSRAYGAMAMIHFDGIYYRHDIGHRALKKP